jgi:glycosyltransferase involved in cell wall biosynthesis
MNINQKIIEVSIIIPVYNRINYISRAMTSVFEQTFKNYELIIIDDGSTDSVEERIFPEIKKKDYIKYLRHSNIGTPLSLNSGIKLSEGKFITFLDSDDEYMKNHIEERVEYFKNNPETDLIYSPAKIIGEADDFFVPDAVNPKKLINIENCFIGATFFGKAEVFGKLKGFKNIYGYDYELYKRAEKKFKVARFDLRTYVYYRNTTDGIINVMKRNLFLNTEER